jgi:hypothetical protein
VIARRRSWILGAAIAVAVLAGTVVVLDDGGDGMQLRAAAEDPWGLDVTVTPKPRTVASVPTTTAPTTTSSETTAAPTTAAPPPTAPPEQVPPVSTGRFTYEPYAGLGTWLDAYDWSVSYGGPRGGPTVGLADIDRMAALGVRTVYIQASKHDSPTLVLEQERLLELIGHAHALGLRVVAWYLPSLVDPQLDLDRLLAIAQLPVDGLGVDIEPTSTPEAQAVPFEERTARLVWISTMLRQALPGEVLGAIPVPPVVFEINPNYWPGYPWAELGALYDVWQPMTYWTFRRVDSGWRDAYTYIATNIDRLREFIGRPDAVVHPVGGVHGEGPTESEHLTPEDVAGMAQASAERGAIGGSLYDYVTTHDALWAPLAAFNG